VQPVGEAVRYRRNPAVTATTVDEEIFLVEPGTEEIFYLDAAGAGLWRLIEKPRTLAEILVIYGEAFPDTDDSRLEADLRKSLKELLERGLAVNL
jgi:Coenzyme PQQ synthesis protein D (PqqD)